MISVFQIKPILVLVLLFAFTLSKTFDYTQNINTSSNLKNLRILQETSKQTEQTEKTPEVNLADEYKDVNNKPSETNTETGDKTEVKVANDDKTVTKTEIQAQDFEVVENKDFTNKADVIPAPTSNKENTEVLVEPVNTDIKTVDSDDITNKKSNTMSEETKKMVCTITAGAAVVMILVIILFFLFRSRKPAADDQKPLIK